MAEKDKKLMEGTIPEFLEFLDKGYWEHDKYQKLLEVKIMKEFAAQLECVKNSLAPLESYLRAMVESFKEQNIQNKRISEENAQIQRAQHRTAKWLVGATVALVLVTGLLFFRK